MLIFYWGSASLQGYIRNYVSNTVHDGLTQTIISGSTLRSLLQSGKTSSGFGLLSGHWARYQSLHLLCSLGSGTTQRAPSCNGSKDSLGPSESGNERQPLRHRTRDCSPQASYLSPCGGSIAREVFLVTPAHTVQAGLYPKESALVLKMCSAMLGKVDTVRNNASSPNSHAFIYPTILGPLLR